MANDNKSNDGTSGDEECAEKKRLKNQVQELLAENEALRNKGNEKGTNGDSVLEIVSLPSSHWIHSRTIKVYQRCKVFLAQMLLPLFPFFRGFDSFHPYPVQ